MMKSLAIRWGAVAALVLIVCAAAAPANANDMRDRLDRGEIVTLSAPAAGVQPGRAIGVVDAPPRVLEDVLAGFQNYHSFVPRVVASRQVKDHSYVIESDFPWPVNRTWVYVQVRTGERDGAEVVSWKMINGTLKAYQGAAWIQPYGEGRSLLTYQMLAVPNTIAPDAVISYGLRQAAGGMVEAVRKEAARVLAANPALRMASEPSRTQ